MDEIKKKRGLHPVWFFVFLIVITVVLSFILSLLGLQGTEYSVSQTGRVTTTILTVKSLISTEGLKFIFGDAVDNLLKYIPFGTVIIGLLGMGTLIKTGLLKEVFSRLARKVPRSVMFFVFSLLCIVMGFSQDLAFVIMIPFSIALFTEYKRSQVVGMTMAFVSVAAGANINLFITSLDYSLIEIAKNSVKMLDSDYSYGYSGNLYFIVVSSLLLALLITILTEILSRKRPVRVEEEEKEIDENLRKKGLKVSLITLAVMGVVFVYSIIPNLPLSGRLLDNTQALYVNKLFGANSPFVNGILIIIALAAFVCGLIYGIITKQIKTDRDLIKILKGSLNNIGELLLIIFFAAEFIAVFKFSNIGEVLTSLLYTLVRNGDFSFVLLMLFSSVAIILSGVFISSTASKWSMFSPTVMPLFMKSNLTPEFAGALFRLTSSVSNIISPIFPYFAIYIGFMGLYSKSDFSIKKCYNILIPFFIGVTVLWLFIIFGWYVLGSPIGPKVFPTI